ncbi:MAG: hypothetical protein ACREQ4_07095 [Candidatus Binataceae bacterium]
MSFFSDAAFQRRLVDRLNASREFNQQAQWFDGSVLLEAGADQLWLKIYKGRIIDHQASVPPFGYTFKISGPERSWRLLIDGERLWADLITPGKRHFDDDPTLSGAGPVPPELRTEGNLLEAGRLTEAIYQLAYILRESAKGAA